MDPTKAELKYLPGMGPARSELLRQELGVTTLDELVHCFPYRYVDRSRFYKISEIDSPSVYVQIRGRIVGFRQTGEGRAARLIAQFSDGERTIDLVFFKGIQYVLKSYQPGVDYIVFGKPNLFNGVYSFVHPDIETPSPDKLTGFMPLYHTTEKMKNKFLHSKALQKFIYLALRQMAGSVRETLPAGLIAQEHLLPLETALQQIHFPANPYQLDKARERLKYEELFYVQLAILRQAHNVRSRYRGHVFARVGDLFNRFYREFLPFQLTEAQKRVLREIRADMGSGVQMNRLLQGDVGSGKTIVALMSMLLALDNGYQACIIAPTEILATQHYESLTRLLQGLPVQVGLLKGSVRKKDRTGLHEGLRDGSLQILVGTHAVLEEEVVFRNLGLVVIDEQHRFGVAQRARMWAKNPQPPHVLVMTATPIPRTLAMTVYGDLDVSVIDELPPGRKPVTTWHVYENKRQQLQNFMRQQLQAGRQVYVVYPLIDESEKSDMKNLMDGYDSMCEVFSEYPVAMVHGRMKPVEKEEQMRRFVSGEARLLVATTVIEVGVNVPNASVMVIENAERFGLSQLHQLRGRVGRGADQSFCVLVSRYELSAETRKRLSIMTETTNGFEIAEADLALRGPGDLEGTMQSGLPFRLQLADLAHDGDMLQRVRRAAQAILEQDPLLTAPQNALLLEQLHLKSQGVVDWSAIS
ncbi:MAG: ATP-dependent DNA helicase RecG [Paludibacteraceae bacterium]|nr:ATP-dependent DNA helicase RecG [Paludibacteraceae bacterium]